MKKILVFVILPLSSLAVLTITCRGVLWLFSPLPTDRAGSSVTREYSFDPGVILDKLQEDDPNLFKMTWERGLMTTVPKPTTTPAIYPPSAWTETDFMKVAASFAKAHNKAPLENATLYGISFGTNCDNVDLGPQYMSFSFFRENALDDPSSNRYLRQDFRINLLTGRLLWIETELVEVLRENTPIGNHISAEEALKSAELSGGENLRLQVGSKCYLAGSIADAYRQIWDISYKSTEAIDQTLLSIHINAETGDGQIIWVSSPTP